MAKTLYVGGIPYSSTDDDLRALFSQAGTVVKATIVIDKMTNRSRGFGFVEMSTDEEADAAINMFDGQDFQGRTLKVNEARPLEPRAPGSRPPRSGGGYGGGSRRQSNHYGGNNNSY